jgi:MarR family transcriptional regulator, organic hydroperoxide resistance regulator
MSATAKPKKGIEHETWGLLASLVYPPRLIDVARELDLTPATLSALVRLGSPMTMKGLAEALRCDPSNVTGIVDTLEDRILAVRKPSETDRRIKVIELSGQGDVMRAEALGRLSEPPDWLRKLSAADKRALRDVLKRAHGAGG